MNPLPCSPLRSAIARFCLGVLIVSAPALARAQSPQPVVVVATPGHQHLLELVKYVSEISGDSLMLTRLGKLAGTFTGSGEWKLDNLPGVDPAQPWGLAVVAGGGAPLGLVGLLPVTDGEAFAAGLAPALGAATKTDSGDYQFTAGGRQWTVRLENGWASVTPDPAALGTISDPAALLTPLVAGNDLGIRIRLGDLPAAEREEIVSQLLAVLPRELTQADGEGPAQFAFRSQVTAHQIELMQSALEDGEETTLGIRIDRQANKIFGDWVTKPRPDSALATQVGTLGSLESKLAGLVGGEEHVGIHVNLRLDSTQIEQLGAEMAAYREAVLERAKTLSAADPAGQTAVETLTGKLLDVMQQTAAAGRVDVAIRVVGKTLPVTALVAAQVTQPTELETWFSDVAAAATNDAGLEKVELNAETHAGVKIHALTLAKNADSALFDTLFRSRKFLVAVSGEHAYLAVGPKALDELKAALDLTPSAAGPFRAVLKMGAVTNLAGRLIPDKTMAMAVGFLGFNFTQGNEGPMDDRVVIDFGQRDGNLVGRLEAGNGTIRVGGVIVNLGQQFIGGSGGGGSSSGSGLPFGS